MIEEIIKNIKFEKAYFVIGIDGPTASGKTCLAQNISKKLSDIGIPYFIYQLDWTLIERDKREKEFSIFRSQNSEFRYEFNLHMNLEKVAEFFNILSKNFIPGKIIKLENLYNRNDNGKCTGKEVIELKQNMVIIVEGHYTHHPEIHKHIDLNLLLYANDEELIKRKISRSNSYRNPQDIKDYYFLIDKASFSHYLKENLSLINFIINNNDFLKPLKIKKSELFSILKNPDTNIENPVIDYFSISELRDKQAEKIVEEVFNAILDFDNEAAYLWGIAEEIREKSFYELLEYKLTGIDCKIVYKNFKNLYSSVIQYSYSIEVKNYIYLNILADNKSILVSLTSNFATEQYIAYRTFAEKSVKNRIKFIKKGFNPSTLPVFIAPTDFYSKSDNFKNVLISNNKNPIYYLIKLLERPCCILYKTLNNEEEDFLIRFFTINFNVKYFGQYLLIYNSDFDLKILPNQNFHKIFKPAKDFEPSSYNIPEEFCGLKFKDGVYTNILSDKENFAEKFQKTHTHTKKILLEYFLRQYGEIEIFENINLKKLLSFLPSYFSDLYLALNFVNNSAISFLTLYDLTECIDSKTYLKFASDKNIPIGLQVSRNALDKLLGYLKLEDPSKFAESLFNTVLSLLQSDEINSKLLWNIGIDHIKQFENETDYDINEFIEESTKNGLISSVCIDFEHLLNTDLNNISEYITNCLSTLTYQTDIEITGGENCNYTPEQWVYILKKIQKSEPYKNILFLLGPALGTKHHKPGADSEFQMSKQILELCSNNNLAGNVLHGTSYANDDDIKVFVKNNCLRINFAGKYLNVFIENLPNKLKSNFGNKQDERKKAFAINREILSKLNKEEKKKIENELKKLLEQHRNILNTHQLSDFDYDFFYNPVCNIPPSLIAHIVEKCLPQIEYKQNSNNKALILASMIEVPDDDFIKGLAKRVYDSGIRNFHIDVSSEDFSGRNICAENKFRFLQNFDDIKIHVHIMAMNPHLSSKEDSSLIQKYLSPKTKVLYVYRESFNNDNEFKKALDIIELADVSAGIVIENSKKITIELLNTIKDFKINNVLLMAVSSGKGGQKFNPETFEKISKLKKFSAEENFPLIIEVDGGINLENAKLCSGLGADYISGWSVFIAEGLDNLEKRIKFLLNEI